MVIILQLSDKETTANRFSIISIFNQTGDQLTCRRCTYCELRVMLGSVEMITRMYGAEKADDFYSFHGG